MTRRPALVVRAGGLRIAARMAVRITDDTTARRPALLVG